MRILTVFLALNLLFSVALMVFGLESTGVPSCESSFDGGWFEGSSDSTITEKWEWKNLGAMYPSLGKSDEEVDPASIFGKVTTSQGTEGEGVVGLRVQGNVSGPGFAMKIGPGFEIRSITLLNVLPRILGTTTSKSVKSKQSTSTVGAYTLNGSGSVVAVSGGGGLSVLDTGFQTSGTVTFSFSPTAATKVLNVTVDKDLPKAYECGHQGCEAALPSKDYHLVTCGADIINHHGGIGHCREKYYICQGSCLLAGSHVSGSGGGSGTSPSEPTDNTPNCQDCTSHCSSPCSCTNSGTCNGTVVDDTPNCSGCTSHCSSPCSCSDSGTCNGTVAAPTPPPPPTPPPELKECSEGHLYNPNNASEKEAHTLPKTCKRSGCNVSMKDCQNLGGGGCFSGGKEYKYHWL